MAFFTRCVNILDDLADAEQAIAQLHQEPKGTLRINAPMSFGTLHLASALAVFISQYPDLQVQLTLADRFVDPLEEGFDITLRIAEPPTSPSLIVHPIAPVKRILCAASAYLERRGVPTDRGTQGLEDRQGKLYSALPFFVMIEPTTVNLQKFTHSFLAQLL